MQLQQEQQNTDIDYGQMSARILQGETSAENMLAATFHAPLITFLNRLTRDWARAEDLTHDTLIIILQKLRKETLEDPARLPAYIYQTARYVHLGWIRKQDNRQLPLTEPDAISHSDATIEDRYIQKRETLDVRKRVLGLRMVRDREILLRRFFADETKPETCEALHLTHQHYDRVLSRARKRLCATA